MLDDTGVTNYDDVEMRLNQPEMTSSKARGYLKKILKGAKFKKNQLKGYQTQVTKQFKSGAISEAERQENKKRIQNANATLTQYIKYYDNKLGSGIRKKGGHVMFLNDPKQLLKKLEIIIGEIMAGNTSIKTRNTGVALLDTLLRLSAINKSQYN